MNQPRRISLIWIVLFAVVATLIVMDVSANGGSHSHDDDGTVIDLNADSNIRIAGDKLLALTSGLGGVDIEGCVVTIQRNFVIIGWQSFDYNFWCIARDYDLNGQYKVAAAVRCDIKQIRKRFQTIEACEQASNFRPKKVKPTGKSAAFAALEERLNRYDKQREEDAVQRKQEDEDRAQASRSYARQQQVQQQQYEEVQQQREEDAAYARGILSKLKSVDVDNDNE